MRRMRCAAAIALALQFVSVEHCRCAQAQSGEQRFQISPGDLGEALKQLALQAHVQIIYPPSLVEGKKTGGLTGHYTPMQSLSVLLKGSGLVAEQVNLSTFVLKKLPLPAPPSSSRATPVNPPSQAPPMQLGAVIVTGNLREESLDQYAGSITPMTGGQLNRIGTNYIILDEEIMRSWMGA